MLQPPDHDTWPYAQSLGELLTLDIESPPYIPL